MNRYVLLAVLMLGLLIPNLSAQWAATGTTNVAVTIGPEAALQVTTGTTNLTNSGLFSDFTGTTSLQYKVRTTKAGGSGAIQLQVTTDFGAGGPSVAAGNTLSYTCAAAAPATACSGSQGAQTTTATSVVTFGANAHSEKSGNGASVGWTLVNDPTYETGSYTAVVTFTISAT